MIKRMRIQNTAVCFFAAIFFISLPGLAFAEKNAAEGAFGIMLAPSVLHLSGTVGQAQTASATIFNQGKEPLHVKAELNDMINKPDEKGRLVRTFLPPGSTPNSCAKWINFTDREFTVAPGTSKVVEFLISSPADAKGGRAAAIFFKALGNPVEEEIEQKDKRKPKVVVQIQPSMGLMIFYEIDGTVKRTGNLLNMEVIPSKGNEPLKIRYDFENTGNTDILLEGNFHILDANKALVARDKLTSIRTFPGDKGASESTWSGDLPPGKYHMVVTLEPGPDAQEVIVREFDFTI